MAVVIGVTLSVEIVNSNIAAIEMNISFVPMVQTEEKVFRTIFKRKAQGCPEDVPATLERMGESRERDTRDRNQRE